MKPFSTGLVTAALVVGLAGSVTAYRSAADGEAATTLVPSASTAPAPPSRPAREAGVRWAPCTPPAELVRGVCVTEVVRTVVVPPSPSQRVVGVAGTASAATTDDDAWDDDDQTDQDGEDDDGDEGDEGEDD